MQLMMVFLQRQMIAKLKIYWFKICTIKSRSSVIKIGSATFHDIHNVLFQRITILAPTNRGMVSNIGTKAIFQILRFETSTWKDQHFQVHVGGVIGSLQLLQQRKGTFEDIVCMKMENGNYDILMHIIFNHWLNVKKYHSRLIKNVVDV